MNNRTRELEKALYAWMEYFEAIRDGEYENNRRTKPLRTYEEVLLLKSKDALDSEEDQKIKEAKKLIRDLIRTGPGYDISVKLEKIYATLKDK